MSVTECRQCGQRSTVTVLRSRRRRLRYWCRRCGAVVSARRPSVVRNKPVAPQAAVARGPGATDDDGHRTADPRLGEVMAPAMLRWLRARPGRPVTFDRLDKSTIYQLYRQWDTHLRRLGPEDLAGLAVAGEPAPVPDLPAFSAVVGTLHEACYDSDRVVDRLAPAAAPQVRAALRERAEHARRWLSHRSSQCWIVGLHPPEGPAMAEPDEVKAAIAALRAGTLPAVRAGDAARAAAFGTTGGPSLPKLLATYPAGQMVTALESYLDSGARPLRDDVLARLAAPPRPRNQPVAG